MVDPVRRLRVVFRVDVSTEWTRKNTLLLKGEPGVESDTDRMKIGDGELGWNALPYFQGNPEEIQPFEEALEAHKVDPTPHPAYDDGPSFVLLYQNKKV